MALAAVTRVSGSVFCGAGRPARPAPTSCTRAAPTDEPSTVPQQQSATVEGVDMKELAKKLPKSGYFSLADPDQEVYSKAGERFDPTKRGGRFKPEFIWNTDWQKTLEMQESLERKRKAVVEGRASGASSGSSSSSTPQVGAVGLSRLADLDRMDVDLSEVLRRKKDARQDASSTGVGGSPGLTTGSGRGTSASASAAGQVVTKTVPLPRNDVKRLERSSRVGRQMVTTVVSTKPEDEKAKAELAAQELARYTQEQAEQRLWVAAFSVVGAISTYASYGREVCISYTLGALGGYVYLRLLGRSVDSLGDQGMVSGVTGALGNQRLLIPLILALGYNRWNTLYADEYGVHLNLLAMLVGFLTYKIAVITRQGKQYLDEASKSARKDS